MLTLDVGEYSLAAVAGIVFPHARFLAGGGHRVVLCEMMNMDELWGDSRFLLVTDGAYALILALRLCGRRSNDRPFAPAVSLCRDNLLKFLCSENGICESRRVRDLARMRTVAFGKPRPRS